MPSYVVYKGKVPGVYDDWEECRRQVHHFNGNRYKGYTTRAKAEARYARYLAGERRERRRNQMKTSLIAMMLIMMTTTLFYVMVV
uniref:Ribonuclease H1 N-terminal domain-containing protein n=1 Tax=Triticum urartu TaxID=4572 RepID=A0A8R7TEH2_TRIUA